MSSPQLSDLFVVDYRVLQGALANQGSAWSLQGFYNPTADLIIFCKRRLPGLVANRVYTVDLTVEIATDAPPGCGATGPKGEGTIVKAGLAKTEPVPFMAGTRVTVNIDKGQNVLVGGTELAVIGDISKPAAGPCVGQWELKTLTKSGVPLVASPSGDGWLVAGIHMAYWGPITVYLTKFQAAFR